MLSTDAKIVRNYPRIAMQHIPHPAKKCTRTKRSFNENGYSLFSAVDELVLIGALIACLHTGVLPQLRSVVVELLLIVSFKHIQMYTVTYKPSAIQSHFERVQHYFILHLDTHGQKLELPTVMSIKCYIQTCIIILLGSLHIQWLINFLAYRSL